jgi:hypothetical protein
MSFCGLANTTVADGLSTEVVLRAWGAVLGTPPVVDPTCERDLTTKPSAQ